MNRPGNGESKSTNVWPDEAAEAAFLTDARERGDRTDPAVTSAAEAMEETDTQGLPPLEELVKRIPPGVRDALDDFFRAKFTSVRRVPKKALKE
ncbi:MAG: hypothetical protein EXS39_04165 [Opitutaceae bacterium]|nr:hypothetical protein [Opitutaceae bacterium]